jgi:hypothetical protein
MRSIVYDQAALELINCQQNPIGLDHGKRVTQLPTACDVRRSLRSADDESQAEASKRATVLTITMFVQRK